MERRPGLYIMKVSWRSEKEGKCTCIVDANTEEEAIERVKRSKWAKKCKGGEIFKVEEKMCINFLPFIGVWE